LYDYTSDGNIYTYDSSISGSSEYKYSYVNGYYFYESSIESDSSYSIDFNSDSYSYYYDTTFSSAYIQSYDSQIGDYSYSYSSDASVCYGYSYSDDTYSYSYNNSYTYSLDYSFSNSDSDSYSYELAYSYDSSYIYESSSLYESYSYSIDYDYTYDTLSDSYTYTSYDTVESFYADTFEGNDLTSSSSSLSSLSLNEDATYTKIAYTASDVNGDGLVDERSRSESNYTSDATLLSQTSYREFDSDQDGDLDSYESTTWSYENSTSVSDSGSIDDLIVSIDISSTSDNLYAHYHSS